MSANIELARLTARISGRVQGVGYRLFARRQAQALGLSGYVRNLPWDDVEVMAEGARNLLEQLLEALWRGPASARVQHIEVEWGAATGEYDGFRIEH
jgi:acylphosphatase